MSLPLEECFTFKNGEKLYTYREQDFGKISSRYYRNVNEAINYIHTFALTKTQWNEAMSILENKIKDAFDGGDKTQVLMDVKSTIDYFKFKMTENKNATQSLLEAIFCMFYLLEGEVDGGYNEVFNDKKIKLLNSEEESVRDFFFQSLKEQMGHLGITYVDDTLMLLMRMQREAAEMRALQTLLGTQTPSTT